MHCKAPHVYCTTISKEYLLRPHLAAWYYELKSMQYLSSIFKQRFVYRHLLVLVLAIGIGGYTAVSMKQDVNYDLLNYHYNNPYALLHGRVVKDLGIGELESYHNPTIDIPAYLAINHLTPRKAAGVIGMMQGVNIWVVYEICLVIFRRLKFRLRRGTVPAISLALAITSFYGAASLSEVGNTMGDNLVSILVLAGFLLVLKTIEEGATTRRNTVMRLVGYGLLGGAMGLKLTSLMYTVGLVCADLATSSGALLRRAKYFGLNILAVITGMLAAAGFWYVRLLFWFGSPIFPFYNHYFRSKYYPPINFTDKRWLPINTDKTIMRPFDFMHKQSIASELPFRDPRVAFLIIAGLVLLVVTLIRLYRQHGTKCKLYYGSLSKVHLALWVFIVVSYVMWLKQFGYYRYLIPVELLALPGIALACYQVIKKFIPATIVIAALCIYITTQTVAIDWGRVPWQTTYFGVQKSDFTELKGATILVGGYAPIGFMVPYFPTSSQTIRVESDLTSPATGTVAMQNLLHKAIEKRQQQKTPFYAIYADEEAAHLDQTFRIFGYTRGSCTVVPAYVRQNNPSKIRLCHLLPVQQ
ncbi:MAG: hypothetical protein JWN38_717 [Candidatus Saccharibacteria bacterium]|nr:hypothetical protein [Candidatus Saccharibacteria bacterium]